MYRPTISMAASVGVAESIITCETERAQHPGDCGSNGHGHPVSNTMHDDDGCMAARYKPSIEYRSVLCSSAVESQRSRKMGRPRPRHRLCRICIKTIGIASTNHLLHALDAIEISYANFAYYYTLKKREHSDRRYLRGRHNDQRHIHSKFRSWQLCNRILACTNI